MAEGRDISEALRDAVDRTVQATVDTRGRAQAAADDLAGSVDDIVKGAGENISSRRRSVREAVGKSLPATQEDIRALRTQLDAMSKRLDALEKRPATKRSGGGSSRAKSPAKPKPKRGGSGSSS